jgi:predicted RND superfamily exporter protein
MTKDRITSFLETMVFRHRPVVLGLFAVATVFMAWSASHLRIDAGFAKNLPHDHPYMETFLKHQQDFGGANRVLVAMMARKGDIFTAEFLEALKKATDEVFFLPGVDRSRVQSLFTPNVRYTEVVEDGIAAGNVIPDDFQPDAEGLAHVRRNVLKAGIVGRLVANDFSGTIISAELLEIDPSTGKKLDFIAVSNALEEKVRRQFDAEFVPGSPVDVRIIGFAKIVGSISAGTRRVILFFLLAFVLTGLLVYVYSQSLRLSLVALGCSAIAVVWQLGLLTLLGYGIDPMSILVPFLIFAIGVSHAVQMISANGAEIFDGADPLTAARNSFRRLLAPGFIALASDTIGFFTILLIRIRVIQEIAIAASLGVAVIILTNLVLIPVILSYLHYPADYNARLHRRAAHMAGFWRRLAQVSAPKPAAAIVLVALALFGLGWWKGSDVKIGDLHRGVPELRADSRYNVDSAVITSKFSIGVDILNVIVETKPEACVDHSIMTNIDDFAWNMENVEGVQSTIALPGIAKVLNAGWNEGSPKWRVLARNQSVLQQSVTYIPTTSGLLNSDCSVMPVMMFTADHKAGTIERIVAAVKRFEAEHAHPDVKFRLATGNVGVMAATNEVVSAAQFPILVWVFGTIILLCLATFRSVRGTLCIIIPLALVSLLAYAIMAWLKIGLKVSTLPVVALGVGVGVDYGIYIYARFRTLYKEGVPLTEAYRRTLAITGNGVLFTGITLGLGVATWIFSPLKFQADMGLLLCFLFLMNMVGALVLLPALARWLLGDTHQGHG